MFIAWTTFLVFFLFFRLYTGSLRVVDWVCRGRRGRMASFSFRRRFVIVLRVVVVVWLLQMIHLNLDQLAYYLRVWLGLARLMRARSFFSLFRVGLCFFLNFKFFNVSILFQIYSFDVIEIEKQIPIADWSSSSSIDEPFTRPELVALKPSFFDCSIAYS